MSSIVFGNQRGEYGFLALESPAPFNAENKRWKNVLSYYIAQKTDDEQVREKIRMAVSIADVIAIASDISIRADWDSIVSSEEALSVARAIETYSGRSISLTVGDMVMLQGLIMKFGQNPALANRLRRIATYRLQYNIPQQLSPVIPPLYGGVENLLGYMIMYVRNNILSSTIVTHDYRATMFNNLYEKLFSQGYTTIEFIGGVATNVPIRQGPQGEVRGMVITSGTSRAILDVFLGEPYKEARLKEVLTMINEMRDRPRYFIVAASITKGNMSKVLRTAIYNDITIWNTSELAIVVQNHMLCPRVERVAQTDPMYEVLNSSRASLPEISVDDILMREKGYKLGDIIKVYDFSPHYRVVIL